MSPEASGFSLLPACVEDLSSPLQVPDTMPADCARLACQDGLLSLWYCKPKSTLSSISCLGRDVLSQQQKITTAGGCPALHGNSS